MWSNQQALAPGAFNRRHDQRLLQWVKTGLHGLRLPLPDGNTPSHSHTARAFGLC